MPQAGFEPLLVDDTTYEADSLPTKPLGLVFCSSFGFLTIFFLLRKTIQSSFSPQIIQVPSAMFFYIFFVYLTFLSLH